jgi:competence transcription factor ComK
MRKKNLIRDGSGKFVKMERKESFHSFWKKYLENRLCFTSFQKEIKTLQKNKDFSNRFGKYLGRNLTIDQIKLLKEEFS